MDRLWMDGGWRGEGTKRGEAERSDGRNSALRYATRRALFNPLAQEKEDNMIVVFSWILQLGEAERKREDIEEE